MADAVGRRAFLRRTSLGALFTSASIMSGSAARDDSPVPADEHFKSARRIQSRLADSGLRVFNVMDARFGAKGDGQSDDTRAIQAALDSAGPSSIICFPPGTYRVSSALQLESAQQIMAVGGSQAFTGQSVIQFSGSGGALVRPKRPGSNTVNVMVCGLGFDGGGTADTILDFTQTSYSEIRDVHVTGSKSGAIGLLLDARTSGQAYFNVITNLKAEVGNGTNIALANGANVNTFIGGRFGNAQTGVAFGGLSSGNTFVGCDFESNSVQHVYIPAGNSRNAFYGVHMENAPIGFNIEAAYTVISGPSIASNVKTPVRDASGLTIGQYTDTLGGGNLSLGHLHQQLVANSVATNVFVDPMPIDGTSRIGYSLFRNVSTTGARRFTIFRGDGTGTMSWAVDAANGQQTLSPFGNMLTTGIGSPEGLIAAVPGSLYLNARGGAGGTLFVKESGTGATGWIAK